MSITTQLQQVLDTARWAPSGDNTQPWRFKVVNAHQIEVHGFDTSEHCVYDLDGHPSQIAMGALLETLKIAASTQGWDTAVERAPQSPDSKPVFTVQFEPNPSIVADALAPFIQTRSVQRRAFSARPLRSAEVAALEASIGENFGVLWLASQSDRRKAAFLMFKSAKLRLTIPEAFEVHRAVIEWNKDFSEDKIPDRALGSDAATTWLMRHIMKSWTRVQFFNRFLAGTWMPRIQLDLIPGLACAAHFALYSKHGAPQKLDDYVAIGRAVQRFWLTATQLGLQLQPEITPLVFARYARENRAFSREPHAGKLAERIHLELQALLSPAIAAKTGFMGRVGEGPSARSRSTRRPLESLLITND